VALPQALLIDAVDRVAGVFPYFSVTAGKLRF